MEEQKELPPAERRELEPWLIGLWDELQLDRNSETSALGCSSQGVPFYLAFLAPLIGRDDKAVGQ